MAIPYLNRLGRRWRRIAGNPGSRRSQLVHAALGSGGIGMASRFLRVFTAIALARILGAEGYGIYAYAGSIVMLLSVPSELGLPRLVVREVAANRALARWGYVRGLLQRAMQAIVLFSVGIIALAALVGPMLSQRIEALDWTTFAWALLLVPLGSLSALRGSALRGLHHIVTGQLPGALLRPIVFLLLISIALWAMGPIEPYQAMMLSVISAIAAFAVGSWLLWRALPSEVYRARPVYETKRWMASALPFGLLAGITLINSQTDIIMLGLFSSASDVGIYRVATQGAMLVSFALMTINTVLSPNIASLHASGDWDGLQRLITTSARATIMMSAPVALTLIILGRDILATVFGSEYSTGALALAVLCIGQLINVGFGPVGNILNMTGHERDSVVGVGIGAASNVILNLILIPRWGIEGAAIASAVSILIWNSWLTIVLYRRTGLLSVAIYSFR